MSTRIATRLDVLPASTQMCASKTRVCVCLHVAETFMQMFEKENMTK